MINNFQYLLTLKTCEIRKFINSILQKLNLNGLKYTILFTATDLTPEQRNYKLIMFAQLQNLPEIRNESKTISTPK